MAGCLYRAEAKPEAVGRSQPPRPLQNKRLLGNDVQCCGGWCRPARLPAPPDTANELALERPTRLACGAALLLASCQIGLRGRIGTGLGHRDLMQETIQPAV